ncbi:hypothetical protein LPJ61_002036 [Coemansia biformis]|uniref:TRIP4/RQT4 C2HC5-type zinc finger domain-containing protein n=1 Tax=Coemansia biformis TaxID=1286918 RepID=A0A9W7YDT3_9FUNG|nr:hypothetical protein LPJ61_002036 [Coemansia biformis]
MAMQRGTHELTAAEQAWATQQVATIIGATQEDAAPLAAFLSGIGDANELQGQLLDMLGESPLALDFAFALIAKRFPADEPAPPPLPPRETPRASPSGSHSAQAPAKSQRQIKRERQQQAREQKEEEVRRRRLAQRKRVRCECQAAEHGLFTNCLACGRIICESEGPGPCMFCGSQVDSPDQQLQQHMRRQLQRKEDQLAEKASTAAAPAELSGSHRLMAGEQRPALGRQLLWNEKEPTLAGSSASSSTCVIEEPSEEEYLERAFRALGVDREAADGEAVRAAEAWVAAARRKERLLGFDRTAAQRTRLIDESADFDPDAVGKWTSPEERAAAEKRQRERAQAEEEREARLRRGVRVLRLNLGEGSASFSRTAGSDDDGEGKSAAPAASQQRTQAGGVAKPAPRGKQPAAPATSQPAAPRFVLAGAKKAQRAARGTGRPANPQSGACAAALPLAAADAPNRRRQLRVQLDDDPSS